MTSDLNPANTPLLLIAWRRPHTLRQVIDAIRPVAPTRLFVACDGPNPDRPGEAEKVAATRAVIDSEIDWPCHIERLYADTNQGCRLGVSRAISWFFEQVEEGIILEDDVVPYSQFFEYCTLCLDRYRTDSRVWAISASLTNKESNIMSRHADSPLHFRYNFSAWGWASWANRWSNYSSTLDFHWFNRYLESITSFCGQEAGLEMIRRAKLGSSDIIDTWDYQVGAVQASLLSFSVHPNIPLVRNIGFGIDATHTLSKPLENQTHEPEEEARKAWMLQVHDFFESDQAVPPFIREVSDLAYKKDNVIKKALKKVNRIISRTLNKRSL